MFSPLGAMLRISLRRSLADWPIVASAAVICLLAATVLAAGSLYGSSVAQAGLQRALAAAGPADGSIRVSSPTDPGKAAAADAAITAELQRAFGAGGGTIWRTGRSDSYALPGQAADAVRGLAILGSADAIEQHATLTAGAWPADDAGPAGAEAVVPVAVSTEVASRLGLTPGTRLTLDSRLEPGTLVTAEVVGIFSIDDAADPFWGGDSQVLEGLTVSDRFDTNGPFFTTPRALWASSGDRRVSLVWTATPDPAGVGLGDVSALRGRVEDLRARLKAAGVDAATVQTGLPDLLATTDRSLLVSRSGVLLLTIQLVVLAAYAALLSASLLVEHRRVGTAMLRSRGAGTREIVGLSLIEGLVITVAAALLAPWLASAFLRLFNVTGPLADISMTIEPGVTIDAFVAAAAGAAICLAALLLPAFRSARSVAGVQGDVSRGPTRGLAQRVGLDIALLAVAAIGLWQLRLYGAPLTQTVQGAVGLDPLLIATPAIGLLAGAIVALRLVPLLAELIERATRRRRGLVPSLGARQLARRPLRYTRAALLLVLAMAMGVFAVSYTNTWTQSQADQAAFQVGADVRVSPGTGRTALPRWSLGPAYAAIPGVTGELAVDRENVPTSRGSRTGRLIALDAATARDVVSIRPDLADAALPDLLAPLAAARPTVEAVKLPGRPTQLRLAVQADLRVLGRPTFDQKTQTTTFEPVPVSEIAGYPGLALSVIVRDADGALYRFSASDGATIDPGSHELVVPLGGPATVATTTPAFAYPLELIGVEVTAELPQPIEAPDATVSIGGLSVAAADGDWHPVQLDLGGGWRSTASYFGSPHEAVETGRPGSVLAAQTGTGAFQGIPSADAGGRGVTLAFAPATIGRIATQPIPIVASDRFLGATGAKAGDRLQLVIAGVPRDAVVTGVVRAFPATDPADPTALIDLPTLNLLRYEGNDSVPPPDEWWLSVDAADRQAVAATLARAPLASSAVVSQADRGRSLAGDPVALGIIGGLAIGFVAAAVFAVVGFVVSASVSARERVTEFALLRALGLSSGQLSVWLSLENAVLAAVSMLAGTLLGLLMAWLVLPFITVTQGATTPYPPVNVDVPWSLVAILIGSGLLALGATIAMLAWLLPRIGLAGVLRMSED